MVVTISCIRMITLSLTPCCNKMATNKTTKCRSCKGHQKALTWIPKNVGGLKWRWRGQQTWPSYTSSFGGEWVNILAKYYEKHVEWHPHELDSSYSWKAMASTAKVYMNLWPTDIVNTSWNKFVKWKCMQKLT